MGKACNAFKHGADSTWLRVAGAYVAAVLRSLSQYEQEFRDPRFFRPGAGMAATSASREKGIRQPDKILSKQSPTNKTEHRQGAR